MMALMMKMTMNHPRGEEGRWVQEGEGFPEHDGYDDVEKKKSEDGCWARSTMI